MRPRYVPDRGDRRVSACLSLLVAAVLSCCCAVSSVCGGVEITKIRYWTSAERTRVVLDLSGATAYDLRQVGHPERIALNLPGAVFREQGTVVVGDGRVLRIRRNTLGDKAQVVLDLAGSMPFRHFALEARDEGPDRIVVDVLGPLDGEAPPIELSDADPSGPAVEPEDPAAVDAPYTVVVDPGHGGMDPGAIRKGVREKDVVLAIARQVVDMLNGREGVRAVLTREGDHFISLAERVQIAQAAGGDLLLSIHANTHTNTALAGMEAYFLSLEGATDSEAQALADKENAADRVGLAPTERQGNVVSILTDLRMSRNLKQANRLADHLIGAARRSGTVEGRRVKQAGFLVLRSLDMPSVLVEAAYLSNDHDRGLLRTRTGQTDLAGVLLDGVLAYLGDARPDLAGEAAGWETRYRVRHGDTLWRLAQRHATSVQEIRERNSLRSDRLSIGQSLLLP